MVCPECTRGGGVSHILAEKKGVSFTLSPKMHENAIFSPIWGGGGCVRRLSPVLDLPLVGGRCKYDMRKNSQIPSLISADGISTDQ